MSFTKPPVLSPEEIDRLFERWANRGGKITMVDPGFAKFQAWGFSTIGVMTLGLMGWGIKSINDLNQTMTRVVTQNEYRDDHVKRIEQHLDTVDGRVVTLERKGR